MVNLKNYAQRRLNTNKNKSKNWKYTLLFKKINDDSKFLDVGCAEGTLSNFFSNKSNYYGIDYNTYLVDYCKKRGLNVKKCDLIKDKIPFKNSYFDVIYCSHVLEHLSSREQFKAVEKLSQVLKPNGILFIFTPTPYHWYFYDDHTHVRPCTHGSLIGLARDNNLKVICAKYSLIRYLPNSWQRFLRLPPLRWFLWETYIICKK